MLCSNVSLTDEHQEDRVTIAGGPRDGIRGSTAKTDVIVDAEDIALMYTNNAGPWEKEAIRQFPIKGKDEYMLRSCSEP